MAEAHPTHSFVRGDDWPIDGSAHNADWSPMSLAGATVEWQLKNSAGTVVLTLADTTFQIIDEAAGKFRIVVPRNKALLIAPGTYRDQCRITGGTFRSTQWYGVIEVGESFFEAPLAPP